MQTSFFVRTVHPSRLTSQQQQPKIVFTIDPPKVEFLNYPSSRISISKIVLRNQSRVLRKFSIAQPSKNYFEVKCRQKEIAGRQSIQIFVGFNPQKEKGSIEDEFIIRIEGQTTVIHVPIYCQQKTITSSSKNCSSKQLLPSKQNELKPLITAKEPATLIRPRRSIVRSRNVSIDHNPLRQYLQVDLRLTAINEFEQKFRRISDYVKEKYVKNEIFLGQSSLSKNRQSHIRQWGIAIAKSQSQRLLNEVRNRHQVEYQTQGPVIQIFGNALLGWETERNCPELTFQWGLRKLQEEVRKYVVSLRFEKIQNSLRIYQQYRAKQISQKRRMKVEQYLEFLNCRLEDSSIFSDYEFEFDKTSLKGQWLPIAPSSFGSSDYQFEITQRIGFDNWLPMNTIASHYQQLYQLVQLDVSPSFAALPPASPLPRRGASQQFKFKEPTSETAKEAIQIFEDFMNESSDEEENEKNIVDLETRNHRFFHNCSGDLGNQMAQDLWQEKQWMNLGPLSVDRWPWKRRR